jgi:predicted MPP superfamily phosphohydrolase
MRNSPFWLLIIGLMVFLDLYVFQAVRFLSQAAAPRTRTIIAIVYWTLSIGALLVFVLLPYLKLDNVSQGLRSIIFSILISLFFAKLLVAVFLLLDDIRRLVQWIAGKLFFSRTEGEAFSATDGITRSHFLTWLGIAAGGGILTTLIYGFSNKYDYHVRRVRLNFKNLPQAFRGLKVVQISDVHSGSFNNKAAVERGIDKILQLNPDLILFTGDLVNNRADEMDKYKDVFSRLKAPMGVYSVLGNHDYGDYEQWPSAAHKRQNLDTLKGVHGEMGWKLLLNQNAVLERGGEQIAILGVENWGAKARFPKYGRIAEAYKGVETVPFKILMSHDPSHWDAEIRPNYPDIDLMLAGHTHGMQFGVELPWLRWSPVQYVYQQWAGLYEQAHQKLYVNRGFGFLGYPGRVGILPEITLIELA